MIIRDAARCVVSDTHAIMNMYGASPAEYAGDKFSELIVRIWCRSQKNNGRNRIWSLRNSNDRVLYPFVCAEIPEACLDNAGYFLVELLFIFGVAIYGEELARLRTVMDRT